MFNKVSIFTLSIFIISLIALICILTSDYIGEYLLGYGIPISIISGFALVSFVLTTRQNK